ncbi:regulator of G-protein signaling 14 [Gadus morhua]|uniref:regulator of G-protein signaling 14 n=1 Tax=Gadus morhua TaxID=8049 RepID=UPI0011B4DA49|nr:regulator of G-protein signaling 14-like [Gadus morhua]
MAKDNNHLGLPMAHMGQAVSDGELNMSTRGCAGSSSSLPGIQISPASQANSVLSWAVSFEKLLEDPTGVRYFTDFLNSEVSAENIMFWQACEEFQKIPATSSAKLKASACSIYQTYLACSAPFAVNITDTAKNQTQDLESPTPDMFDKAQSQIFKLMKMDSYRRFVRSPLYQSCSLASVEGRPLPSHPAVHMGSWEDVAAHSPSSSNGKMDQSNSSPGKQRRKRGSWGAADMLSAAGGHMSVKSTSSMELGSLYRRAEDGGLSPGSPGAPGGRRLGEGGYCCVFLPDGSASLAPTRAGLSLRDMLAGLCEKRGFPLKDVIIYLRDKPLSMDQDCSVLRDQQVTLELRVMLTLEVVSTGKTTVYMVKSSRTLQDTLSVVLQKNPLKLQDTLVTMSGSSQALDMATCVYQLANKTLQLHSIKDKDSSPGSRGSTGTTATKQGSTASPDGNGARASGQPDRTQPRPSKICDIEEMLELLARAQCCRVDDQRGPLTREHLELPAFLLLPAQPGDPPAPDAPTSSPPASSPPTPPPAAPHVTGGPGGGAEGGAPAPPEPEPKSLKETSIGCPQPPRGPGRAGGGGPVVPGGQAHGKAAGSGRGSNRRTLQRTGKAAGSGRGSNRRTLQRTGKAAGSGRGSNRRTLQRTGKAAGSGRGSNRRTLQRTGKAAGRAVPLPSLLDSYGTAPPAKQPA